MKFNIFLTNLAEYNAGRLKGEWVDLLRDDVEEAMKLVLGDDEEYFITDYENELGVKVEEYDNIDYLTNLAESLDAMVREHGADVVKAVLNCFHDTKEAIEVIQKGYFSILGDVYDERDLGYAAVEEGLFGYDIPDGLEQYLDYELIGATLRDEGWIITSNGVAVRLY